MAKKSSNNAVKKLDKQIKDLENSIKEDKSETLPVLDKKKIEEKLSDIYWQKAEDFFDYLAYDVCKKVKTESKIRELHDMGEIDYNAVYEYWHDIMDDMDEEERENHKTNAELIREIFEKN